MMPKNQETEDGHFAQHLIHSNQILYKYKSMSQISVY
jgi:hypothetical protein